MSASPDQTSAPVTVTKSSNHFFTWVGSLVVLVGLLNIIGWYAHWEKFIQLLPNTAPMQFNTALCFILCGSALALLATGQKKAAFWVGLVLLVLPSITLLEYLSGWDCGVDLLFFTPYFETATAFPGRMAPLSGVCFDLLGMAVWLFASRRQSTFRLALIGVMTCIVVIISFVALLGFIFGIESAYGWGAHSSLAVNTSGMFFLLSLSLLVFAWREAQKENYNFLRWLPVTGSITMMMMVAFVAAGDLRALRAAMFWSKHTVQVMLKAQMLENDLIDIQRGTRGYATRGETNSLTSFENASAAAPLKVEELFQLTLDNPSQQKRIKDVAKTMVILLAYDNRLIKVYRDQGIQAAIKADETGEGRVFFGNAHETLKAFMDTEQKLLDTRDAMEDAGYHKTERLLVFGCGLAVALLLIASYMANYALTKSERAEARLALQAVDLRRSNAELEQFAYVASHDLREPLRTMSSFAQVLKEDYQGKLDQDGDDNIDRIVEASKRMANIIDDLLTLSRISTQKKPFEKKPLETPLMLAVENLTVAIREKKAVVKYDPLPSLMMDSSLIVLLFQNLIANAIKFCAERAPEVQIKATPESPGQWKVSICDNGIGIEPQYFDKIFGIFQRLHTRDAYAGTGIGLAICKKIVERHGGRIWLDSKPGIGTTFHFTLTDQRAGKI